MHRSVAVFSTSTLSSLGGAGAVTAGTEQWAHLYGGQVRGAVFEDREPLSGHHASGVGHGARLNGPGGHRLFVQARQKCIGHVPVRGPWRVREALEPTVTNSRRRARQRASIHIRKGEHCARGRSQRIAAEQFTDARPQQDFRLT